jgi:hypothetical protein
MITITNTIIITIASITIAIITIITITIITISSGYAHIHPQSVGNLQ